MLSPDNQWVVEAERPAMPALAELSEPVISVAGVQLNPMTHGPAQTYGYRGLTLKPIEGGRVDNSRAQAVNLPQDAHIRNLSWSLDSRYLAFTLTRPDGIELWVFDPMENEARRLTDPVLNAVYGAPCDWLPKDEGLLCKVVPRQAAPPEMPAVPQGPRVEENRGQEAPARTYTNLLTSPHDEALFEYYLTSVLEQVSLDGRRRRLTSPLLIDEVTPSPDGEWILQETIHRPFSYQVPAYRFPKRLVVLNRDGEAVYPIADLPLAEDIPIARGSVRSGRRRVDWRSDRPATLYWVEALDGGDPRQDAELRDALFQIAAPFTQGPETLWQTEFRFNNILWGTDDLAIGFEFWPETKQVWTWQLDPSQPDADPILLAERDWQDAYSHPGYPVTAPGEYGWYTLLISPDDSLLMSGEGVSPEGVYPFLDRWDLSTGARDRLWQAQDPFYETILEVLDPQAQQILTWRQSQLDPPSLLLRDLQTSAVTPVVTLDDPLPWYRETTQEIVRYEREDGIQLSGTLYLPPGYQAGIDAPLPTLLWIYPEEFESAETAGQVTRTENGFRRPYGASPLFLLTQGYAVLSYPSMPIVGSGDSEPNDTYVDQLLLNAQAAVDYLTDAGISDPGRIAVGGHSYGAFTAANLLAHSDLFCAGIARSGAYNRSLTPFGFQGEARHFWEAQDTYMKMSPFMAAADIDEPLLLIHGAEDDNTGTYPVQSERLYEALRGLGGDVRWVELPLEGHSYRSRESVGHVLWEMSQWMERCS
ncbi:MAG: prolyl oligopeptidase family serine peptidase [Elainellaceae cyanobacterium]